MLQRGNDAKKAIKKEAITTPDCLLFLCSDKIF